MVGVGTRSDAVTEFVESSGAESGSSGFKREYRLRKTDEFSSVFAFRRSLRRGAFQVFYRPNGLQTARLGVVVGKRFVRFAVRRNRLKRIVREVFRMRRSALPPVDVVVRVTAKPGAGDLGGDVKWLLDRLRREHLA